MGISQLLPLLEKSKRVCHVSEFRGQAVAVDSYCWLHKGARSCALQLAKGEKTDLYVTYCMRYVEMLLSFDIKPIMVFDGRHLPAKLGTEEKRRETKKQARKQGMEYLRLGQSSEAYKYFCQCVEVTPEMALALIKECRKIQVDCIVAPYESDAQLGFFSEKGVVDCVITEDSDLLLFGCQRVLYKMDQSGSGLLVEADKLYLSMKIRPEQYSFEKFRHMCILSGCDYLDSLPGIGLKKALKFITMTAETDPAIFLDKVPRYLNLKKLTVPQEYKENFLVADATFKHQIVFNPFGRKLVPLNPVDENDTQYCRNSGERFDNETAYQLALGNLNPLTLEKMDNWDPDRCIISDYSIWSRHYKRRPLPDAPAKPKPLKIKMLDAKTIEKMQAQHDEEVQRELEFYKSPIVHSSVKDCEAPPTPESKTSPVLSSNPFIKKKSKFLKSTHTNDDQKVFSRFFSRSVSRSESLPLTTSEDEGSATTPSDGANVDSPEDVESSSVKLEAEPEDDTNSDGFQFECECILEVEDRELEVEEVTLASVENLPQAAPNKKRKLEQDPKKKVAKQMTIQDMWKKMKTK